MARARVHQHVNPLAKYFRELSVKPLSIEKFFSDPSLPLHLDIGAGRGRFLLEMARIQKDWNFLGTEIREPLVIAANEVTDKSNLTNLHYEFCNVTVALDVLLGSVPANILQMITIQFPDPWFKKKHAKRRMVNGELIEAIVNNLAPNGRVFIQTDVEFLAEEMIALFENNGHFENLEHVERVLPVKTERERSVENRKLPFYSALFGKKNG